MVLNSAYQAFFESFGGKNRGFPNKCLFVIYESHSIYLGYQLVLSQFRSVMKGSVNAVRGYSLSCGAYYSEKPCDDSECRTCEYSNLVRNFPAVVNQRNYVEGFERE